MPYTLAFADRYIRKQHPLTLTNTYECEPIPFKPLNQGLNDLRLRLTDKEFTKLWSAMLTGAELMFPDDVNTLQMILLQASGCVDELPDNAMCTDYLPFAPFISYAPQNPYNQPDLVPSGYLTPPFRLWSQFESILPDWVDNWLGGLIDWATGYQQGDIVVDISSIPLFANWLDLLTNGLPRIAITVQGTGVLELHLLAFPLGGNVLVSVDVEPNLADIFNGIIGGDVRVIELNRDIIAIPPETDLTVIEEIEITTEGSHTVYVTFIPALDDALIPVRFGGGFRKVELCGFAQQGQIMGIQDIRLTDCGIEAFENGGWTEKISQAQLAACFGGGGDFVQELRVQSSDPYMLQRQKNGAWQNVIGWEDYFLGENLYNIEANASGAYTLAVSANNTANNAQNTANNAVAVNNTQQNAIDNLFTAVNDLDGSIQSVGNVANNAIVAANQAQQTADLAQSVNATQNGRLTVLEGQMSLQVTKTQNLWIYDKDFTNSLGFWNIVVGSHTVGAGIASSQFGGQTIADVGHNTAILSANDPVAIQVEILVPSGDNPVDYELFLHTYQSAVAFKAVSSTRLVGYIKAMDNTSLKPDFRIIVTATAGKTFYIARIKAIGLGLGQFPNFGGDGSFIA